MHTKCTQHTQIHAHTGPIPFKQSICDRWSDFTTPEKLRVCIGTWNVTGGRHIRRIPLKNQSMHDWLLDGPLITGAVKEHVRHVWPLCS